LEECVNTEALRDSQPKKRFELKDFDGSTIISTCSLEYAEYDLPKFWRLFSKPNCYTDMEIEFSDETGEQKGSWKGGVIATSKNVEEGETMEDVMKRYAEEKEMTFVKEL
jgi:hypothetical protein